MPIKRITPREVYELAGKSEVIIMDARTEEEYLMGHIEGALNIPLDEIERLAPVELPDLSSGIAVCCKTGRRSELAALALHKLGYKRVYDMGALTEWEYGFVTVD
ncbi:MAG: rhodanese-like domain-containing protein [Eubacteriales bacterium]